MTPSVTNSKPTLLMCSHCPLRFVLRDPVCNRSVLSIIYLMTPARPHSHQTHVRVRKSEGLLPVSTAGRCSDISLRRQMKPPISEVTTNKLVLYACEKLCLYPHFNAIIQLVGIAVFTKVHIEQLS